MDGGVRGPWPAGRDRPAARLRDERHRRAQGRSVMDASLIGETAAKVMDSIGDREGDILAVAIICAIEDDDGGFTHVEFSTARLYEQLGLIAAADVTTRTGET